MILQNDEIIGVKIFKYKGNNASINLYKPTRKWDDGNEFACKYSVLGRGIDHQGESVGYDSMQAIILALATVGLYINESDVIERDQIYWPGGTPYFPDFGV